ncbi:MAG: hypothetical protein CMG74_09510 [Candidatus Marinimicrobia bacterium]|nr:hypothetical protein [Candidatus Neomarinimicrobiota bacterium]|tara:strand:+ start:391 stop:660 length:270 start_codon:yes stop_codon:yes gene_type:complete
MYHKLIQKIIRWLPFFLMIFLFLIDRNNLIHVLTYIFILLSYTGILVLKILYAKENWHKEFGNEKTNGDELTDKSHGLNNDNTFKEKIL